jgi:hypothetical protein
MRINKYKPALREVLKFSSHWMIILLLVFAALPGCLMTKTNITEQTLMYSDDGIIVTGVRTNVTNGSLLLYKKGENLPSYEINIRPIEDIKVFKLGEGEYSYRKITRGNSLLFDRCGYFSVQPNTVSYVGDLIVEWSLKEGVIVAYVLSIDRETETMAEVKKQYPWLFKRYAYKKDILKCK